MGQVPHHLVLVLDAAIESLQRDELVHVERGEAVEPRHPQITQNHVIVLGLKLGECLLVVRGLGLAFVQEVARLHSGRLNIVSELNKGSRFTLTIPLN